LQDGNDAGDLFQERHNLDLHTADVLRKPKERRVETGSKQRVSKRNKSILL
jgi:hypothetical protein